MSDLMTYDEAVSIIEAGLRSSGRNEYGVDADLSRVINAILAYHQPTTVYALSKGDGDGERTVGAVFDVSDAMDWVSAPVPGCNWREIAVVSDVGELIKQHRYPSD